MQPSLPVIRKRSLTAGSVGERSAARQVASVAVSAIEVDGLEKRYGDVHAVQGVSFAVARGETFGILGPNGAGKTTTLEMIEGLTRPDAGSIEILGQPVWPNPTRVQGRIGVQLQKNAMFENLTAAELLDLFAKFYGVPLEGRAPRLLALVGLDEKADAQARQLSGGQQQRLAIALALVHDPEIVFLDEPTTGLDPQARRNLWDVIRAVAAENRTVVLTTHYLDEAETLCDRVAIMDGGRIIALDSPQALIDGLRGRSRVIFEGDGLDEDALAGARRRAARDERRRRLRAHVHRATAHAGRPRGAGRGARHRAARPRGAPADARGRLPRRDRHGVPRVNAAARLGRGRARACACSCATGRRSSSRSRSRSCSWCCSA